MPIAPRLPADARRTPRIVGRAVGVLAMVKLWRWARAIDKVPPTGRDDEDPRPENGTGTLVSTVRPGD